MGHVNMTNQDRILPPEVMDKVRAIEHVAHVEPYLLAMAPVNPPNFVMHVGLAPNAVKRLESHGEAGNPRIIAGRDFTPADAGQDVGIIGQGYAKWAGIKAEDVGKATLTIDPTRTHPVIYAMNRPKRELKIGTLKAIGASNAGVAKQFLAEAVGLTVLGGVFGLLLFKLAGEALTGRLFAIGIGPFLPSHYKSLFDSLTVGSDMSPALVGTVLLTAVVAAVLGSAYGVWQATKLSPLEAMKHE